MDKQLQTHVWHKDKCFFVSTAGRQSSAAVIPAPWYSETIAWKTFMDGTARGKIVAQAAEGPALDQHMDVVKQLLETGEYQDAEDIERT